MPIYEYACRACGREFEALVRNGSAAECPACRATDLEKKLSAFAVGRSDAPARAAAPAGACGSCGDPRGPGACARN